MRLFEGTEFDIPPRCDHCGALEADCECPPAREPQVPPEKQTLRLQVEKRKKGKLVTVVRGLCATNDNAELLSGLKNHCGSGGTLKDNVLEIQGDHLERISGYLKGCGFRLK